MTDPTAILPFQFLLSGGVMFIGTFISPLRKRLLKWSYTVTAFLLLFGINFLILTRFDAQMRYFAYDLNAGFEYYEECDLALPTDKEKYEECSARYNRSIKIDWPLPEPTEQYWRWLMIPPFLRPACETVNVQFCEIPEVQGFYTSYSYPVLVFLSGLAPFISVAVTWFILKSRNTSQ